MGRPRIVGVDYGEARVGLAVSDPLLVFAQPIGAYSPSLAISELEQIQAREGIEVIVLGWPLELDGSEGPSVESVKAFEKRLRKRLWASEIVHWDERMTSIEATQTLVASGARKKKRREKGNVDTIAAAIILQEYLDAAKLNP